jgi:acetyl esterase
MTKRTPLLLCLGIFGHAGCVAKNLGSRLQMEGARTEVYKTVDGTQLSLNIFQDPKSSGNKLRPAIVFFHGGGWSSGSPKQFEGQARYFASRGMVAITAEYRVRSRHQSQVIDSVADAR